MGFIKTIINENNINIPASRVGIRNSFRMFFIKMHNVANKIPNAQILILSIKAQTHP